MLHSYQGLDPPRTDAKVNKNDGCFYCGKPRHFSKDCKKRMFNESKYRRHVGIFPDYEANVRDDFENLKLFVSYVPLLAEANDINS